MPTPKRRAELYRQASKAIVGNYAAMIDGHELRALLDATKPVADAKVAWVASNLRNIGCLQRNGKALNEAAVLIERQARELAEVRAAFPDYRRDPCNQPENMR
jgi:hypothetical protein